MLITGLVLIIVCLVCFVFRAKSIYEDALNRLDDQYQVSMDYRNDWLSARANSMKLSDEVSLLKCELLAAGDDAKFWQNEHNSIRDKLTDLLYPKDNT